MKKVILSSFLLAMFLFACAEAPVSQPDVPVTGDDGSYNMQFVVEEDYEDDGDPTNDDQDSTLNMYSTFNINNNYFFPDFVFLNSKVLIKEHGNSGKYKFKYHWKNITSNNFEWKIVGFHFNNYSFQLPVPDSLRINTIKYLDTLNIAIVDEDNDGEDDNDDLDIDYVFRHLTDPNIDFEIYTSGAANLKYLNLADYEGKFKYSYKFSNNGKIKLSKKALRAALVPNLFYKIKISVKSEFKSSINGMKYFKKSKSSYTTTIFIKNN